MKFHLHFFAFFLVMQSSAVFANVIPFKDGSKISLSTQELSEISPYFRTLNPPAYSMPDLFDRVSPQTLEKLIRIGETEYLTQNNKARSIESTYGVALRDLYKIRDSFFQEYTTALIRDYLSQDKSVRLLGRDLNISYHFLISFLQSPRNPLSYLHRVEILRKTKLIHLSRSIAQKLARSPSDTPWVMRQSSTEQNIEVSMGESDAIDLVDLGYDGTIYNRINSIINNPKSSYNWSMFWPSSKASKAIRKIKLPKFETKIQNTWPSLASEKAMSLNNDTSFRVGGIEHQAKWHQKIENFKSEPTYIMLDVDDTILKEVAYYVFKDHPEVQTIVYEPNDQKRASYLKRAEDKSLRSNTEGKVIHFEFGDNSQLSSTVVVRPGFKEFLRDNGHLLASGKLRIHLTSANDENRTLAVLEQVKIDGKSLGEWGVQYMAKKDFYDSGSKSFTQYRQSKSIPDTSFVFAIDDLISKIKDKERVQTNMAHGIKPWTHDLVNNYLLNGHESDDQQFQDMMTWKVLSDDIYTSRFIIKLQSDFERLVVLSRMAYFHSLNNQ